MTGVQAKLNPVGRILGNNYKVLDPLAAGIESKEKKMSLLDPKGPDPQAIPGTPYVDQSMIDRQAADLARRRRGVAANEIAGNTGPATVMTPVLGGG